MNRQLRATLASAALALASLHAGANEAIKMIVPFAPGGPADQIARVIAPALSAELGGRSVVVDNRGGAGGTVGVAAAAKAPADGTTILLTTSSLVLSAGTMPKLPYDPRKDVTPVYLLGEVQTMLVVRPTLGVATLAELNEKARAGKLNYGSTGTGGTMHIGAELYTRAAKVTTTHVPYRGAAPALVDLLAGTIDFVNADVPVLRPHVQEGRLKALVIFDTRRSPLLPEVPTAAEAGMPELLLTNWYGVLVPAATPKAFQQELAAALARAVKRPEVATRLAEAGFSNPQDTAAFAARLDADFKRWLPWLKEARIQAE